MTGSARRAALPLALAALLAACGGTPSPEPPTDQEMQLDFATGRDAMSLERFNQAADAYRSAYRRARADDDAGAIGTAGTDLAIALGAADDPAASLVAAATTRADLAIRHAAVPPELDLAEAAALLRAGRPAQAFSTVAPAENAPDPAVAERAAFLRGLAASETGDAASLAAAAARLAAFHLKTPPPTFAADRAELDARLAAARRNPGSELEAARDAVRLRRAALDDRGMRRALLLASEAARALGWTGLSRALETEAAQSADAVRPAAAAAEAGGPRKVP